MEKSTAQRRIVKSPPELWAEVSSEDLLGRHLAPFGDIRITRTEPETTVAWEGDRASGTVALEPAGWGTNVVLTATAGQRAAPVMEVRADAPAADEPRPDAADAPAAREPGSAAAHAPAPAQRRPGFFARIFRRSAQAPAPSPPAPSQPAPGPEPTPPDPDPAPTLATPEPRPAPAAVVAPLDTLATTAILTDVLDDLGAAHHRPFSRD